MIGYEANMGRLRAEEELRQLGFSGVRLTNPGLYQFVLAATESREQTEAAVKRQMHAQLRAGETPE